jgi:uncharacterized protein (TIGR02145 family)
VRAFGENATGLAYGTELQFTSAPGLPSVETVSVTYITTSSALVGGMVISDGGDSIIEKGICWSTSPSPTLANNYIISNSGDNNFNSEITGLYFSTTYFMRAFATNSVGTVYGNELIATTYCDPSNIYNPDLTYGTMTDQQGRVYKTIVIGTQEWMAENLNTSIYRNGDAIPTGLSNADWDNTINTQQGAYAYYNNYASSYACPYGKLYNWYACVDARQLCPIGWHVPTDAEWSVLTSYLGGEDVAGGKMKTIGTIEDGTGLWLSPNTDATNNSGFSGAPGGGRYVNSDYSNIGDRGMWWSSSESSTGIAWLRILRYNNGNAFRWSNIKQQGFSVRCLRD